MANAIKVIKEGFLVLNTRMGDVVVALPDACDGREFVAHSTLDDDKEFVERITFDFEPKNTDS